MVTLLDYWKEITSGIGVVLTFVLGRKSAKFLEKKQQADAIDTMQKTYNVFLEHYNVQHTTIVGQYNEVLENNKNVTERMNKLSEQFVNLQLAYSKEVEISQNWQKLHSELKRQYDDLEKKYEIMQKLYEKLKVDFDKYKKEIKK